MGVITLKTKYSLVDGAIGGMVGGVALGLTAMLGSLIIGKGLLHPIILVGYAFQPYVSDPVLTSAILFKTIALHLLVSIAGGIIFSAAVNTVFTNTNLLWLKGMIMGGLIWAILVLGGIQALDPTMDAHMNHYGFFVGFMAYGAAMGAYVHWAHRHLHSKR